MWNTMRTMALAGLISLAAPAWADEVHQADEIVDPFEGEWVVQVTPDQATANSGQDAFSEAVLFHNGEFSAAAFAGFGFSPSSYTLSEVTGQVVFTASLTSNDRGTLTWTGHQSISGVVGQLLWARQDGSTFTYQIAGARPD